MNILISYLVSSAPISTALDEQRQALMRYPPHVQAAMLAINPALAMPTPTSITSTDSNTSPLLKLVAPPNRSAVRAILLSQMRLAQNYFLQVNGFDYEVVDSQLSQLHAERLKLRVTFLYLFLFCSITV
jgi:hypothetical protein